MVHRPSKIDTTQTLVSWISVVIAARLAHINAVNHAAVSVPMKRVLVQHHVAQHFRPVGIWRSRWQALTGRQQVARTRAKLFHSEGHHIVAVNELGARCARVQQNLFALQQIAVTAEGLLAHIVSDC